MTNKLNEKLFCTFVFDNGCTVSIKDYNSTSLVAEQLSIINAIFKDAFDEQVQQQEELLQ